VAAALVDAMTSAREVVVHDAPVWRDRSNFVISAALAEADTPHRFEQLFARQVGDDRFELCCIPFFLFDVALGDVVKTAPALGREFLLESVVVPSGRFVFRVWFGDAFHPRGAIAEQLTELGALLEWGSANLLAVDAEDQEHAQVIADYLAEREREGALMYEAGRS
jgi:hypothetical protein